MAEELIPGEIVIGGFPEPEDTMDCPHCKGQRCAFGHPQQRNRAYDLIWNHPKSHSSHTVSVAYCRTCGKPVIEHSWQRVGKDHKDLVYPKGTARPKAPQEVRAADEDLANDYDEAVTCEPHSFQAAAFLLGRCAGHILVKKCEADAADFLSTQFKKAIKDGTLPHDVAEEFPGVVEGRNQAGHPWYSSTGEQLKVDEDTSAWSFHIVDMMFEHFYVAPKRRKKRQTKLSDLLDEKKQGIAVKRESAE